MDKNAIKKYAVWARRELIEKVSQKALQYGIEDGKQLDFQADSINGVLLTAAEKRQRQALIRKIKDEGYIQTIEEVAFTWFNRFIALRFMEVNGYLPSHVRVFTDENNNYNPQILAEALHLEFDSIDKEKVLEMKDQNRDEDLYKYLLIAQCNELNKILPIMFQPISDCYELLLPDYLLREGSVTEQLITCIPQDDWNDQVQIVGWLYQFYNTEPKEVAFSGNGKFQKNEIPAATQLFTPNWIVKYMVDNSLGRLWNKAHPETNVLEVLRYFEEVEDDVNGENPYQGLDPQTIKCLDPCMGSGHILAYAFDVLVKIYEDFGYSSRDAAELIVNNNLCGLDIDERAAQLASFVVLMKARQYDRRIFTRGLVPHISYFGGLEIDKTLIKNDALKALVDRFDDAAIYGSLIDTSSIDISATAEAVELFEEDLFTLGYKNKLVRMLDIVRILSEKYDVVVTNPPYMNNGNMNDKLLEYVKAKYLAGKSDLCTVFVLRCNELLKDYGYQAMITQQAWMFLSSYEDLRKAIYKNTIICMAHLGARAFEEIGGEVVQTTTWVQQKILNKHFVGVYEKLTDYNSQDAKEEAYLLHDNRYRSSISSFQNIPMKPTVYWMSENATKAFDNKKIGDVSNPRRTLQTGDSKRFMRNWQEVSPDNICFGYLTREETLKSDKKWYMLSYGGHRRKWYGNLELVVNWKNNGKEIKETGKAIIPSEDKYLIENVGWSKVTTGAISVRYYPDGIIPGDATACLFDCVVDKKILAGFLNTKVAMCYLEALSPTLNYATGTIAQVPFLSEAINAKKDEIVAIVNECIELSKNDWDSFENSWDFKKHPFCKYGETKMRSTYTAWSNECNARFNRVKELEESLNRIFIDIYGLSNELSPELEDSDITINKADLERDVKNYIEYCVGCMFGRYSLENEGLQVSPAINGIVDRDNIIPVLDDEYFEDDIVACFTHIVALHFGDDSLEDNLAFIAEVLGGNGSPRDKIREYFYNEKKFYAYHCKMYQKTPIYWMFASGPKNGFKCLIYMHRYQLDTVARIRTDYVHEQQSRYRTAIEETSSRIELVGGSEKVKLSKKLNKLKEQDEELHTYEEKIHHLADQMIGINMDDGVKHNYEIFKDVLAKIK